MYTHRLLLVISLVALTSLSGCATHTPSLDTAQPAKATATLGAKASLARGQALVKQGRQQLALEQFTRAAALEPTLYEARYQRGLVLLSQNQVDLALAEFQALIKDAPTYAPAEEGAGLVYFANALYPEAQKHFQQAIILDPSRLTSRMHLGVISNYQGDHSHALETFEAAKALAPRDPAVHNNLGMTLSMLGKDAKAVEAFRTALKLGAPTAKAYNNMGLALARLGRWHEALEAFACAKGQAAAYNNIGYLYFLDEQYDKAVAAFERAMELKPTYYAKAHENLKRAKLAWQFAQAEGHKAQGHSFGVMPSQTPKILKTSVHEAAAVGSLPVHKTPEPKGTTNAPQSFDPGPDPDYPVYTLHQSSWHSRAKAEATATRLKAQGFSPYILCVDLPGKGQWFRVTLGMYKDITQARAKLASLQHHKALQGLRIVKRQRFEHQPS